MGKRSEEDAMVFSYEVNETFIHPNFNSLKMNSDIALIKLKTIVEINKYIHPICLPTKHHLDDQATATGFGENEYLELPDILQKMKVYRYPHEECVHFYNNQIDPETMICYGGRGSRVVDSCQVRILDFDDALISKDYLFC